MTETDKIALLDEGGGFIARLWKKISAPVSYKRTHFVDGVPVVVTVEYGEGAMKEATKQRRRVTDIPESAEQYSYD